MGGQPRPAPVPDGQTRVATQIKDDAAAPAVPPTRPQRNEPMVDATEEAWGLLQRKEASLPTADLNARGPASAEIPSGVTGQLSNEHASTPANRLPDMAAHESGVTLDTGPPGTGTEGLTPGAGHAARRPPPPAHGTQTTGHAVTAPSTAQAQRSEAGTLGDATSRADRKPTRSPTPRQPRPTQSSAQLTGSRRPADTPATKSCRSAPQKDPGPTAPRSHPEPRGDHTGGTPLALSCQAHP